MMQIKATNDKNNFYKIEIFQTSSNMHGTIIEHEQHVRKVLVILVTQLSGCVLLKMLKYFEVMLNIFDLSHVRNCIILIGLHK